VTEEQIEKVVDLFDDFEDFLDEMGLTKHEVAYILYESGMFDEEQLEELCPL
jgi:hypothetical protein